MSSRVSNFPLTNPGALRVYSTHELGQQPEPIWMIEGWLYEQSVVCVYGPPGCGKSFVVSDMMMSMGAGLDWQGFTTVPCEPLYIAAEGGIGMGKRVRGWGHYHEIKLSEIAVNWLTEPVHVQADHDDMEIFARRIEEIGHKPKIVVVDTLARCYEGDENSTDDMGAFIRGIDHIRKTLKCTVVIVHHTRLDGDRERGNTALRGACDTMIECSMLDRGVKVITLKMNKQKDSEEAKPLRMQLTPVPAFDSCVIASDVELTGRVARLVSTLRQNKVQPGSVLSFTKMTEVTGWNKMSLSRSLKDGVKIGVFIEENNKYRIMR